MATPTPWKDTALAERSLRVRLEDLLREATLAMELGASALAPANQRAAERLRATADKMTSVLRDMAPPPLPP